MRTFEKPIFTITSIAFTSIAFLATIAISTTAVLAQDSATKPANPDARFQIERNGEGFVRLDKKTGETSFCRSTNGNLVCRLAIEERDTYHNEITDLQNKLTAAEEKLDAGKDSEHSLLRPKDDVPDTDHDKYAGSERDKFEKELDKAMDFTKFAMKRLFKVVKELQKEYGE